MNTKVFCSDSVVITQGINAVLSPEVVVVGPDPKTDLLIRNFIFYYQLKTSLSVGTLSDLINKGLQGTVQVEDTLHKVKLTPLLVCYYMCLYTGKIH